MDSLSDARSAVYSAQDGIDKAAYALRTDTDLEPVVREQILSDLATLASAVTRLINRLTPG